MHWRAKNSSRVRIKSGYWRGIHSGQPDLKLIDKVVTITNEEAISTARRLMDEEGILAGISSGAAVAAALKLQEDEAFTNKNIVVILPSSGERYLSTALFADLFTEKSCNSNASMLITRKSTFSGAFCGLLQTFAPPGIASPRWVWYLNQQLF